MCDKYGVHCWISGRWNATTDPHIPPFPVWTWVLWRPDVRSTPCWLQPEVGISLQLPSLFMETGAASEGSLSRRASHCSWEPHAKLLPRIFWKGKNTMQEQTTCKKKKRVALFVFAPPRLVILGFTKIYLCFVLLMICLLLFQGSAALFVWECSSV